MILFYRSIPILILLIILVAPSSGQAGIYRYVDEYGRIHYTNVPTTNKFRFYRGEGETYQLESLITHFAKKFKLDRSLLKAVIKVESDFNPLVVSVKGAQGLMQLMPETARGNRG